MSYIILILLATLPFAHFIFHKVDIWHSQGHLFQVGLLIMLGYSFFERPKRTEFRNLPLGIFTLWAGLVTAYYWYVVMYQSDKYAVMLFLPFFNLLCCVFFYKISISYLNIKDMERILRFLSYSVFAVIVYCFLQLFRLDQFYKPICPDPTNEMSYFLVGTIGNSTHLAGYLALCQPLFFKKSVFNMIALSLLWVILLLTRSMSGIIIGGIFLLLWLLLKKRYILSGIITLIPIIILFIYKDYLPDLFSFNGRGEAWNQIFMKFKERPITGWGMGILNVLKITPVATPWTHAHQEFLQVATELGVIGLGLSIWAVIDYAIKFIKIKKDTLILQTGFIFFTFVLLGLFSFPAHLWLLASMGMAGYSFFLTMREVSLGNIIGN